MKDLTGKKKMKIPGENEDDTYRYCYWIQLEEKKQEMVRLITGE